MDRFFIERRKRRIGCAAIANNTIVISVILQSVKAYSHTVRTIIAERCRSFLDTSGGTETILRTVSTDKAHRKYAPTTQSRPCSIFSGVRSVLASVPAGRKGELDALTVCVMRLQTLGPDGAVESV